MELETRVMLRRHSSQNQGECGFAVLSHQAFGDVLPRKLTKLVKQPRHSLLDQHTHTLPDPKQTVDAKEHHQEPPGMSQ